MCTNLVQAAGVGSGPCRDRAMPPCERGVVASIRGGLITGNAIPGTAVPAVGVRSPSEVRGRRHRATPAKGAPDGAEQSETSLRLKATPHPVEQCILRICALYLSPGLASPPRARIGRCLRANAGESVAGHASIPGDRRLGRDGLAAGHADPVGSLAERRQGPPAEGAPARGALADAPAEDAPAEGPPAKDAPAKGPPAEGAPAAGRRHKARRQPPTD